MTELIACLSSGKGTWAHVAKVIEGYPWERVFLVGDKFAREKFQVRPNTEFIEVDFSRFLTELIADVKSKLEGKIKGLEVGVNLISGEGKEHMAILAALLKLGIGVRFVALTPEGVQEI